MKNNGSAVKNLSAHSGRATSQSRRSRTFTVDQAAAVLDVSTAELLSLIRGGVVPAHRCHGRLQVPRVAFACLLSVPR